MAAVVHFLMRRHLALVEERQEKLRKRRARRRRPRIFKPRVTLFGMACLSSSVSCDVDGGPPPVPATCLCGVASFAFLFAAAGRGRQPIDIRLSVMAVTRRGRGRQPIDIRLSVMAVTRRGLPIESITGAEALVESCGDGEPQKKKRATEQSISSSRGETLGSPVYER
ncbi:UNVERIFIED_CONTAM: hypothetical protein FKN15_005494 [Acipenser sinensis]